MRIRPVMVLIVLAFANSCGSATAPRPEPNIQFLAGNKQTDTIQSTLAQALTVRIHNPPRGQYVDKQPVQFQALSGLGVEALGSTYAASFFEDSTDGFGDVTVNVVLGLTAGTARVIVTVPTFGYVDTATFTVTPGKPATVVTSPTDTISYIDAPLTLTSKVFDRGSNPLTTPVSYVVESGATATVSGSQVTPTALGLVNVAASAGGAVDSVQVTAVPRGQFAASGGSGIQIYNLDGSGSLTFPVFPATPIYYAGDIKWSPSGTRFAFDEAYVDSYGGCSNRWGLSGIYTTDLSGNVTTIVPSRPGDCDNYPARNSPSAMSRPTRPMPTSSTSAC